MWVPRDQTQPWSFTRSGEGTGLLDRLDVVTFTTKCDILHDELFLRPSQTGFNCDRRRRERKIRVVGAENLRDSVY